MSTEPITPGERANYETLRAACKDDKLALIVCETRHLGARVTVLCAMNTGDDGSIMPVPIAKMFTGNPYEELRDPTDDMAAASASVADAMSAMKHKLKVTSKDVALTIAGQQGWNDDTILSLLFDFCDARGLVDELNEHMCAVAAQENEVPA